MPGDPVLELAATSVQHRADGDRYARDEQKTVDDIVSGNTTGHYYLIVGEKGTGKSSMLIDAMGRVGGDGISMFEAHGDLEIFRIRLGKALDFEFYEDYIGSLFSIRGPRDTTPLLDIERAFNKLEKVALRRRRANRGPLVLIINSTHLLRDNDDGQDLLELVQQRAEQWAASRLVTVVMNSDDYWVYERLKLNASRMEVLPITDLPKDRALAALRASRRRFVDVEPSDAILEEVYRRIGGRLTYLDRVARSPDMLRTCEQICQTEKAWFLNQCGILGETMDDDVMDQQKYAVSENYCDHPLEHSRRRGFFPFFCFSSPEAGVKLTIETMISRRPWSWPRHWWTRPRRWNEPTTLTADISSQRSPCTKPDRS